MNFQCSIFNLRRIKFFQEKLAGFSLMEVLIAMSILTLILGGVTLFSVRTIQAHTRSQAMQNALENARFAIESINKMARTSQLTAPTVDSPSASSVTFTSNVDNIDYEYYFQGGKLLMKKGGGAAVELVGSGAITVLGDFEVLASSNSQRAFIATEIKITYNSAGSPTESDSVSIRSGVSTRY